MSEIAHLAATLFRKAAGKQRIVVAIAGAPGSGKSTFAETLLPLLPAGSSAIVPMDGFHYDNAILDARGLRPRKGAAETFDVEGFRHLRARIGRADGEVVVPLFDGKADLARAGASVVAADIRFVLVEGNYLLPDESSVYGLGPLCDYSVRTDGPSKEP